MTNFRHILCSKLKLGSVKLLGTNDIFSEKFLFLKGLHDWLIRIWVCHALFFYQMSILALACQKYGLGIGYNSWFLSTCAFISRIRSSNGHFDFSKNSKQKASIRLKYFWNLKFICESNDAWFDPKVLEVVEILCMIRTRSQNRGKGYKFQVNLKNTHIKKSTTYQTQKF